MEYDVTILKRDKHEKTRALWRAAFPEDSDAFLDAYYGGKGRDNEISVIEDGDGTILSMIHWNPVELWVRGKVIRADFLVAVATDEACRRKGMMARLLTEGMERRGKSGMPFVFLTPAKEAYYTPFGFETVGWAYEGELPDWILSEEDRKVLELKAAEKLKAAERKVFADRKAADGPAFSVEPARKAEYAEIAAFSNEALAKQFSLFAWKSPAYLERLAEELASEGGAILVVRENGVIRGACYMTADGPEGPCYLREVVCGKERQKEIYHALDCWRRQRFGPDSRAVWAIAGVTEDTPGARSQTMIRMLDAAACRELTGGDGFGVPGILEVV